MLPAHPLAPTPFPVYPAGQALQVNPPTVLVQEVRGWHGVPLAHSSTSPEQSSPEYPVPVQLQ